MTTLNLQVAASADDAFEDQTGDTNINATDETSDQIDEWFGFRWQSVTVPQGATINSATFSPWVISSVLDEPYHDIYGQDADNAAAFSDGTGNEDISTRTQTTATYFWDVADLVSGGGFEAVSDANIAAIVQEIIDRPGWSSGNAIVFIVVGHTGILITRDLGISSYDTSTARAAKLDIDYTASTPPDMTPLLGARRTPNLTRHHHGYQFN